MDLEFHLVDSKSRGRILLVTGTYGGLNTMISTTFYWLLEQVNNPEEVTSILERTGLKGKVKE